MFKNGVENEDRRVVTMFRLPWRTNNGSAKDYTEGWCGGHLLAHVNEGSLPLPPLQRYDVSVGHGTSEACSRELVAASSMGGGCR